jgi:hypothetical protein
MKKISEIMVELGFNEKAPDSVKKAFIKHLIYVSTGSKIEESKETKTEEKKYRFAHEPEQLSFDILPDKKVI